MSRNATEKAPEKSKFARRCNLLSRYLKQNGSFGGIDLGLTRKPDSDLGLTRKPDFSGQRNETSEMKPIDFMQKLGAVPSAPSAAKPNVSDFSEPEPGTSQLTIFFGGKVIVFNEFPADKAKEIMEIAKHANPVAFPSVAFGSDSAADDNSKNHLKDNNLNNNKCNIKFNNNNDVIVIDSCCNDDSSSKSDVVIPDLNEPTSSGNDNETRQQNQLVERIARRASLHRFFAKRKDRAVARAPYQVNQNAGYPLKPEMASPSSLERGQSSGQANNVVVAATAAAPSPLLKSKGHEDDKLLKEEEKGGHCSKDLELRL